MTTYSTGTISVAASGTAVTGTGTNWLAAGIRAGDQLIARGLVGIIASVNSATSITLARAWPGTALSGAAYDIALVDDGVRSLVAANALLQALGSGPLTSLGQLTGASNRLAYYTGAGAMALTDLTPFARTLLDDADATALWATIGTTAGAAQAYRRGNILGTVTQSAGVPTGALIERGSSGAGDYLRFADGTQICFATCLATQAATYYCRATWTYAMPFAAVPKLVGQVRIATASGYGVGAARDQWGQVAAPTATSTNALLDAYRSFGAPNMPAEATIEIDVMAIGRWF